MSTLELSLNSGYSIEVFSVVNPADPEDATWNSVLYTILDTDEKPIFEGVIHMDIGLALAGNYSAALLGILKGLHEDTLRLIHPHRYDDPKERGLVIAGTEVIKLWLRVIENNFLEAIDLVGSARLARNIYDSSHYEENESP